MYPVGVWGLHKKKQRTEGVKCLDSFAPKHRGISLVVLHGDWCCIDATAVSGKLATKSLNPDDDN